MTNLFELASRKAYRFPSNKGELTVEDLWVLPLSARNGVDLDSVAKAVNAALKAATEESFVAVAQNPAKRDLESRLEIVKHIIAVKLDEKADREAAAAKSTRRAQILELLAQKDEDEMKNKTRDELLAELETL